jgi:DNA (cytosine-5)-methyltransferase 1
MEDEHLAVWDGFNQKVRKDSDTIGTLTGNCHKDLKRNGQGIIEKNNERIRKLTERECGRLMGVKDDDIAKIGKNLSRSAQYHMFGDSIVTSCLMAIVGKIFNVDYESKIKELTKNLTGEG